ncbi:MAG: DUF2062 domain-containing protein [Sphingomonadaceae bacterium]|nr:DUF2062 domain-containing protein [Sphingomonadaceae bacterium]
MAEGQPIAPRGFLAFVRRHAPTREELAQNRFIKPFAHRVLRRDLWRFTRRSVPRGAALGMIVGIFVMIPGLQIAVAALLALPFRANIPVAAAATFNSNPLTTPFILLAAIFVGNDVFGLEANPARFRYLLAQQAGIGEWLGWLASDAAPALVGGLLVIAIGSGVVTYLLAGWLWRVWIIRKWKRRSAERSAG